MSGQGYKPQPLRVNAELAVGKRASPKPGRRLGEGPHSSSQPSLMCWDLRPRPHAQ
jgi:hypothetical protein